MALCVYLYTNFDTVYSLENVGAFYVVMLDRNKIVFILLVIKGDLHVRLTAGSN